MKKFNLIFITLATLITFSSMAQAARDWTYIGQHAGVRVYWDTYEEIRDQWCTVLKIENTNSYPVEVRWNASFTAADGRDHTESGQMTTIKAHSSQSGNWHGMFYYVRDRNGDSDRPPRAGGYRNFSVRRN